MNKPLIFRDSINEGQQTNVQHLLALDINKINYTEEPNSEPVIGIYNGNPRLSDTDYVAFGLIFCYALIGISLQNYRQKISQLFSAFVSNRFTEQLIRESNFLQSRLILFILMLSTTCIALFISQFVELQNLPLVETYSNFTGFLGIWLITLLFLLLKPFVATLTINLFSLNGESEEYLFNYFNLLMVLGATLFVLLLPVNFIHPSSARIFLSLAGVSIIAIWLVAILKVIFIGIASYRHKWRHIILYLCALEILPVLLISKGLLA